MAYRRGSTVVTMGSARDYANGDTSVTQVQGPCGGGKTPTSCLLSIIFTVVTTLLELFGLEEEEQDGSDLPRLRVQTPLYRQGSGYRLGGWLPAPPWLRLRRDPLAPSDDSHFIKWLSPLDRHLGGICPPFCLGFFHGENSCSLIGQARAWLASPPSFASVKLVGARLLSAKQPLGRSCRLCPALALLGGIASRLLAQLALWLAPVFFA
jgi:hypothetical protein